MAEPQTVNCGIIVPNTGDLVGTWGSAALNPDFVAIDGYLGGVQTVSASSVPITLTSPAAFTPTPSGGPTQAQNGVLRFTGTLTAGVQVTLPLPGYMIVENLTTGAFVLSFRAIGSGEVVGVEQGVIQHLYNDGTNVRFVNLPTIGSYMDICDATVPAWITACTKPPWLNCDGTTFSAVTYPYLNTKLGGNTLPDFRGVSPAYLNQGTSRLTSAGSGLDGNTRFSIVTSQTQTLTLAQLPANITGTVSVTAGGPEIPVVNPPLLNQIITAPGTNPNTNAPVSAQAWGGVTSLSGTMTSNNTSGSAHPIVQPTTIGGIRLIRAA